MSTGASGDRQEGVGGEEVHAEHHLDEGDGQPANDPANLDPPINQAIVLNRGAANQPQNNAVNGGGEDGLAANQGIVEDGQDEVVVLAASSVPDTAVSTAGSLAVLDTTAIAANHQQLHDHVDDFQQPSTQGDSNDEDENVLNLDDDANEPSNFQAWYIRSARNRSRVDQRREEFRLNQSLEQGRSALKGDQDIEENSGREGSTKDTNNVISNQFLNIPRFAASGSAGGEQPSLWSSPPSQDAQVNNGAVGISSGGAASSSINVWEQPSTAAMASAGNGSCASGAVNVTTGTTAGDTFWPGDRQAVAAGSNSSSWTADRFSNSNTTANNASSVSISWIGDDSRHNRSDDSRDDETVNNTDRPEGNDLDLSMLTRADRSERLEKLYRSLSLEQSASDQHSNNHQQPINQNRSLLPGSSSYADQCSLSNVNLAALGGALPRGERRNASYLRNQPPNNSSSSVGTSSCSTSGTSPGSVGTLYNWQATKTSVHERFAFMFNNELLADIHFKVGRPGAEQRIPAHKFVLSVGSAVFDAMFNSALAMTEEEICLPDVEPQSFLALLKFLYSDEVQIGPETVMSTLYTAKKYAVPTLERHCVEFLKKNLSPDNACMLLTQARLFDEPQLAALCLDMIDKNTPEALSADGFTDLDRETLSVVLDRDTLRMKESKLFGAVLRWAEAQCQRQGLPLTGDSKRNILGRLLFQVRFPTMTVKEFAQGPAQSGVLTDKETVSLFLHYTVNIKPPDGFLDVPRCSMTGQELSICRFQQIESRWGYSGSSDKIRFIVDTRIVVVGFGLYGSIHGPSEYEVTIQLLHTGSGRILGSNEITFNSDGSNSSFRVMFKEPIEVQPGTNYTAVSTLKGLDSHYGTKGQRKVTLECHSGEKVTFQFSYAAGQNNGTSVEDGQIPEIIFYI
eukprot:TRINITY_DN38355_c0_g2_i7.p1 TRINITY_DN38355_c0_g2~~TRINITY_DN38355_c0_g2_i7.p1  ORF type:complete len:909 (-),score=209.45 TRINITY_DN38355_c0_g2_i7:467-3193(-)